MKNLESLALRWVDENLLLLDQTLLPAEEKWLVISNVSQMIEAIRALRVRGAPLIGVAAAMALAVSAKAGTNRQQMISEADALYEARPTAVNLMICIDRMKNILNENIDFTAKQLQEKIIAAAEQIWLEDIQLCENIANNGAALIQNGDSILTHCNSGGLATAGVGTAFGVIRRAHEQGKQIHVYVDETRPLLQGGRLTAWELGKLGVPYTLITDNMAAHLMSLGKINKAIVGSDRIAANGDFANKIGTYSVAVNCHYHRIPFYVAAPYTTVDPLCPSGAEIPIEQRKPDEVRGVEGSFGKVIWAPNDSNVYNPSFDVTPHQLVTGWVMDKAVFSNHDVASGVFK